MYPAGTYLLHLHGAVFDLDQDGVLSVSLAHSEEDPMHVFTLPEERRMRAPTDSSGVEAFGNGASAQVSGCFPRHPEGAKEPRGFTLKLSRFTALGRGPEGELTVVVDQTQGAPAWLAAGRRHHLGTRGVDARMRAGSVLRGTLAFEDEAGTAQAAHTGKGSGSPTRARFTDPGEAEGAGGCLPLLLAGSLPALFAAGRVAGLLG